MGFAGEMQNKSEIFQATTWDGDRIGESAFTKSLLNTAAFDFLYRFTFNKQTSLDTIKEKIFFF